ncbi:histidinol-phosphate transaminase [Sporosarcina sp. CAU 1771]
MKWKTALEKMNPYKPGRSIDEVKAQYGLKEVVKLASNENPYGTAPSAVALLENGTFEPEMYPDGNATVLRDKLAAKLGVAQNMLLFGGGSDEIIVMISRALLSPETNTVMATPTFPQYAHGAKIEGAEIREISLKEDGTHDLEGFLQAIDEETAVIWLCSPNNPTGNIIPGADLQTFMQQVPKHVLIVLDEAYFEYITDSRYIDTVDLLQEFPNAIILRTFSKAYGLAAFRVGYAIGHPEVITNLNKVRGPFNTGSVSQALATKALDDQAFIQECKELNQKQKVRFYDYAAKNNLHVYASEGNFVLIQVPGDADVVSEKLLEHGFIVRSGGALGAPGYVRVTIGTEEQNTGFFEAFDTLFTDADLSR